MPYAYYPRPHRGIAGASGGLSPVFVHDYTATQSLLAQETFSASGQRTMYDSTGKLTYGPNNLYINSNSGTNTARTIATSAGVNYYIWIQTSSGSATIVASGTNTSTFNGSAGGTFTAFTATAGTLTLTPTSNFANITQVVVAAITYESALRSGDNVITGASAYYGPRFDYNPNTLAALGLLLEAESRTNLLLESQTISNVYWNNTGDASIVAVGAATAPDGTLTASEVAMGTSPSTSPAIQSRTYAAGNRTASIWAKAKSGTTTVRIGVDDGSTLTYSSDLTVVSTTWTRLTLSYSNASSGTGNWSVRNNAAGNSTNVYLWGAQDEAGVFASSYIPTTTASVTRATETLSIATNGLGLSSAYTIVAKHDVAFGNNNSSNQPEYLNGVVSGADAFDTYWGDATHLGASVNNTVPTAFTVSASDSTAAGATTKYAFAVDSTQPKISMNGAAAVNIGSWSGTALIPTSSINVGNYLTAGYENPSAHYAYIAIYNSALYASLQTLST